MWGKLVISNHPGQLYEKEQAAQILNSWFKARSGNKGVSMMKLKESFISCSHRTEVAKNGTRNPVGCQIVKSIKSTDYQIFLCDVQGIDQAWMRK